MIVENLLSEPHTLEASVVWDDNNLSTFMFWQLLKRKWFMASVLCETVFQRMDITDI